MTAGRGRYATVALVAALALVAPATAAGAGVAAGAPAGAAVRDGDGASLLLLGGRTVLPGPVAPDPAVPDPLLPDPVLPDPVVPDPVDPVDPGPVDPGPVDPGPVDPGPVDPGPVDPGPVDPGPVDPGPVDPGPVGPVDPGPVDPGPVGPDPGAPGPVDPSPVDPTPVDPVDPAQPGPGEPGPVAPGPVAPGQVLPGPPSPGPVAPVPVPPVPDLPGTGGPGGPADAVPGLPRPGVTSVPPALAAGLPELFVDTWAPSALAAGPLAAADAPAALGAQLVLGGHPRADVVDDEVRTRGAAPVVVPVLANDVVPEGVTVTLGKDPRRGSAAVTGAGVRYVPDAAAEGTDAFTYVVALDGVELGSATVRVTVLPPLDHAAVDDHALVVLDDDASTSGASVTVPVLANDVVADGSSVTVVDAPAQGRADVVGDAVLYTADPDAVPALVTFVYRATSPDGALQDDARVVVRLVAQDPGTDGSVAVDDVVVAAVGERTVLDPTRNDHVVEGAVVDVDEPCFAVDADGGGAAVAVQPSADQAGAVLRCRYRLLGGGTDDGDVVEARRAARDRDPAEAVVTVLVQGADAVDDRARAVAGGAPVTVDVLANDTGLPDAVEVAVPQRTALGGTLTVRGGTVVYEPPARGHGLDAFRYELRTRDVLDAATVLVELQERPAAPRHLVAWPGDTRVSLHWDAPAQDGGSPVLTYELSARPQVQAPALAAAVAPAPVVVPASRTSYVWPGLTNGVGYRFEVVAVTAVGRGPAATASATPFAPPGAPTSLRATPGDRSARVSWAPPAVAPAGAPLVRTHVAAPAPGTVTRYVVTWRPTVGAGPSGFRVLDADELDLRVTNLENGRETTVAVRAWNGRLGPAATVAVVPRTVPGAPEALTCPVVVGPVTCSWSPPLQDGGDAVTAYVVRWAPAGGGAWQETTVPAATPTVVLAGLTTGTRWTVTVAARNAAGVGPAASTTVVPRLVSAADDAAVTGPGVPVVADVTANDSGVDPDLVLDLLPPATGTAVLVAREVHVTPTGGAGPVEVVYRVLDGTTELARATLRVDVVDAVDDVASTTPGTQVGVPVLGNDLVDGVPAPLPTGVEVRLEGTATNGEATLGAGGSVLLTPSSAAPVSVTYALVRGDAVLDRARVDVTVTAGGTTGGGGTPPGGGTGAPADPPADPPEDPPVDPPEPADVAPRAVDDAAETPAGRAVTVPVLGNDVAADGAALDPASVRVTGTPAAGTATARDDGTVLYVPRDDARGVTDRFGYTVRDGAGRVVQASVTVRVGPVTEAGATVPGPGGTVALRGSGCVPGEPVRVTVDGGSETDAGRVDGDGRFAVDVAAPAAAGRHRVVALCGVSAFATDVDVVLSTSATASAAPVGAGVVVAGLLGFYMLSGSLLAPRGTSVPGRRLGGG